MSFPRTITFRDCHSWTGGLRARVSVVDTSLGINAWNTCLNLLLRVSIILSWLLKQQSTWFSCLPQIILKRPNADHRWSQSTFKSTAPCVSLPPGSRACSQWLLALYLPWMFVIPSCIPGPLHWNFWPNAFLAACWTGRKASVCYENCLSATATSKNLSALLSPPLSCFPVVHTHARSPPPKHPRRADSQS